MLGLDPVTAPPPHDVEAMTPLLAEQRPSLSSSKEDSQNPTGFILFPPKWVLMVLLVLAWFLVGVAVGVVWESWPVITAVYVMVQIITTVGYGDEIMHSQGGKLMMSFHVLFGVAIVATVVTSLIGEVLARETEYLRQGLRKMEAHLEGLADESEARKRHGALNRLIASASIFLFFTLGGTLFYGTFEPCTCVKQHKGRLMEIKGCIEGPKCVHTGGHTKTWVDVFYMSVITLTTVGFGDYTPTHTSGQVFAIFWMLLGTLSVANFVTAFAEYGLDSQKTLEPISKEVFDRIDKDGNGKLSKVEFRSYALVKLGFCTQEELDQVDHMFSMMDHDNSGSLSYEEIHTHMDPPSPRVLA